MFVSGRATPGIDDFRFQNAGVTLQTGFIGLFCGYGMLGLKNPPYKGFGQTERCLG
jgi:hypothetical protein